MLFHTIKEPQNLFKDTFSYFIKCRMVAKIQQKIFNTSILCLRHVSCAFCAIQLFIFEYTVNTVIQTKNYFKRNKTLVSEVSLGILTLVQF
jgi:hypothetical protein